MRPCRGAALLLAIALCLAGCVVPAFAHTLPAGRWFWIASASAWQRVRLQPLATAPHVTVYGSLVHVSSTDARRLAQRFSSGIYPTDIRLFGRPTGLVHVGIVLTPLDGSILGYFNEDDLLPALAGAYSNHGNFLYVRPPKDMPDRDRMADVGEVAAHELQHLIDFRLRVIDRGYPREETWLNEGLSFYAQLANRFFTPRDRLKVLAAAQSPGWRVTSMVDSADSLLQHARTAYGRAGLFVTYLANRFGSGFIRDVLTDPHTGMTAINDALRARHQSLSQAFADWGVASLLNRTGVYGYGPMSRLVRANPRLARPVITSLPYDSSSGLSPLAMGAWSHLYLRICTRRDNTLSMRVEAPTSRVRVALVLAEYDQDLPQVIWLRPDARGHFTLSVPHFGVDLRGATIVAADTSNGATSDRIRVKASLVDMPDNN